MGNVNMEARQIHYRGGNKPMSVEEAIKEAGSSYVLPVASAETLGGVKVGEGLSIDADGVLSTDSQMVDYSTTEQATGQKWVDGKDIYFKTIDCGALPNNTTKEIEHGISSIDSMVKIEGIATNTTDGVSLSLPLVYESSNSNLNTRISVDDTKIYICTNADRSSYDTSYVTLYYTKTT